MKLAIDIGHGVGNRSPGVYDPGAVGHGAQEHEVARVYGDALADECARRGLAHVMVADMHVASRAAHAQRHGATHLLSIHLNAASGNASGTETIVRSARAWADAVQAATLKALGLKSRGVKPESATRVGRLAVLNFPASCLVELGFITNAADVAAITATGAPERWARAILDGLGVDAPETTEPSDDEKAFVAALADVVTAGYAIGGDVLEAVKRFRGAPSVSRVVDRVKG